MVGYLVDGGDSEVTKLHSQLQEAMETVFFAILAT